MDQVSRAFYELEFENRFLRLKGQAFQDLFADVMEKRYPGDFIRIRAGGPEGDHKADGYLQSEKKIYQVYAPAQMGSAQARSKIQEDFNGARKKWKDQMKGWVFVHNSRDGLLPAVVVSLNGLANDHSDIAVGHMGFEELRRTVFELGDQHLAALLGPAPSGRDLAAVSAEDLKPIIMAIASDVSVPESDIRPVPPEKLSENQLSLATQTLLRAGMVSADKVQRFFDRSPDPGLGDKVAGRFKIQYGVLKSAGGQPDEIFLKLREFAAGSERTGVREDAAVLALLAYLFEQCDIFERPTSEAVS